MIQLLLSPFPSTGACQIQTFFALHVRTLDTTLTSGRVAVWTQPPDKNLPLHKAFRKTRVSGQAHTLHLMARNQMNHVLSAPSELRGDLCTST